MNSLALVGRIKSQEKVQGMKPIQDFSHEELVNRVSKLEAQVQALHAEIREQERLDYGWTGQPIYFNLALV